MVMLHNVIVAAYTDCMLWLPSACSSGYKLQKLHVARSCCTMFLLLFLIMTHETIAAAYFHNRAFCPVHVAIAAYCKLTVPAAIKLMMCILR